VEPVISVIIPTRNSARTLPRCLDAILAQRYPRSSLQILIADAGSTDETLAIAHRLGVDQVIPNPLLTAEAGKAAALRHATGEFIALIDSDNYLAGDDWFTRMLAPWATDSTLILTEPLYFHHNPKASLINRYCALMGLNDPLCFYTGNFDRWNFAAERWTALPLTIHPQTDWFWFEAQAMDPLPTIGANGTVYRRSALTKLPPSDYFFDVDVPLQLRAQQPSRFAKVHTAIEHDYGRGWADFMRKQQRRIRDYQHHQTERIGQQSYSRKGVLHFILATVFVFPCLFLSIRGWMKKTDVAWFLHWPLCALTLSIYAYHTLRHAFTPRH
jgi:hypothetical protein